MATDRRHPEHEEALLLRDAMIAGLAGAASDVAEVGKDLYRATVMSKVQRAVLFTTLALVFVMLAIQVITSQINRNTLSSVQSCTEPTGECYERNQARTAEFIRQLLLRSEAANYCSPRAVGVQEYKRCLSAYPDDIASIPPAPIHSPHVPAPG